MLITSIFNVAVREYKVSINPPPIFLNESQCNVTKEFHSAALNCTLNFTPVLQQVEE